MNTQNMLQIEMTKMLDNKTKCFAWINITSVNTIDKVCKFLNSNKNDYPISRVVLEEDGHLSPNGIYEGGPTNIIVGLSKMYLMSENDGLYYIDIVDIINTLKTIENGKRQ